MIFKEAFEKLNDEQFFEISRYSQETLEKWKREKRFIDELKEWIKNAKNNGKKNLAKTIIIRPDVCNLVKTCRI